MSISVESIIAEAQEAAKNAGCRGQAVDHFVIWYLAVLASAAAQTTSQGFVRAGLPPVEPTEAEELPPPTTVQGEA